ncbi:hypothetical protein SAMN04488694_13621 [Natrinema hispanicum]|uniref:Uncharacterized protein n=1 Tax=Natrinema hispanicum TaxID=392421 RepID=A0A1I0JAF6_9EURY|nr:hypothetical protein SAMN04488694_13621 [Natrinema hispanicum]
MRLKSELLAVAVLISTQEVSRAVVLADTP